MFGNFDDEARKVLGLAKKEMVSLKHPYVGSEHLLLAILKNKNDISDRLKEFELTYDRFKKELIRVVGIGKNTSDCFLYTPLLKRVIENAILDCKENDEDISINHLFSSLLEEGEGVAIRILLGMNIDLEELYDEFSYKILNHKSKNSKLLLDELGVDLTSKALKKELDPVIGRDKETRRVIEILSRRTKNNPLLVGSAGVGKTAIVENLANLISNNIVPLSLRGKRIISLDMASAVAGTKYRGEFEDRIRKIIDEVEHNSDIILFIDEVHTLVGAGGAEGAIDASNIFKPALARGKMRVIGSTTTEEYKKYIESDKALARRFQNVYIEIPNRDTVYEILSGLKNIYENYHKVCISDDVLKSIIDLSEKYIHNRNQPDKSIDILDEVCAYVSLKDNKNIKKYNELSNKLKSVVDNKNEILKKGDYKKALELKDQEHRLISELNDLELVINKPKRLDVTLKDVAYILNIKTKIPIYELLNDDIKMINNIEKSITNKLVGQDNAISSVIKIIKRIKLGYKSDKCYSVLFCGPSGVGKSYLAKLFSSCLTTNMIKLDMSDYMDISSITKIIGSSPGYIGYDDNSNILEEVKNMPFSVIILDEIEKAHPAILNLFLQILDDGKIKNSRGEYIYFNNAVIVMTSNSGYETSSIGFNNDNNRLNEYFSVPFLNRIDNVIYFNYLEEKDIIRIVDNKIKEFKEKYSKKNIDVNISLEVINQIIKESNYKEYGARKIDKIIEDKIENYVIDRVLEHSNKIEINNLEIVTS